MFDYVVLIVFGLLVIAYLALVAMVIYKKRKRDKLYESIVEDVEYLRNSLVTLKMMEEKSNMIKNNKTLEQLTVKDAQDKDYDRYLDIVAKEVKELYEDFAFQIHEPVEDQVGVGWTLEFQIMRRPEYSSYDDLFRLAISKGLDNNEIIKRFADKVKSGEVIDLGEVEILGHSTGVSPVTSGDDVRVLISFITPELKAKQEEIQKEKEAEAAKAKKEAEEKATKQRNAYMEITKATQFLNQAQEEVVAQHPELTEALEDLKRIYGDTLA